LANHAIVVAAGQGTRFGGDLPKQFLLLHGRPILAHTLLRMESAAPVAQVVVVAAQPWVDYIRREIVARFQLKKCVGIVAGGERRQDSVWAGLQALSPAPHDLLIIHDAVRPLFSMLLLESVLQGCAQYDGCIPALPLADTVKQVEGEAIVATLDRAHLRLAQTPQVFRSAALRRAFEQALREQAHGTDEAALVERSGGRVCWVPGEPSNLKITTPEDLKLAEFFAKEIAHQTQA